MDLSMMRNVLAIAEVFIMYVNRSLARSSVKHLLTDRGKIPARAAHSDMQGAARADFLKC